MSGLSLITNGMLSELSTIQVYNVLPIDLSITNSTKKINIKVAELKNINILKIDSKKLNIQILHKDINIQSNEIKKINIKRS